MTTKTTIKTRPSVLARKVREMIPRHGRQGSEAWQVVVFVFVIADLKNIQAKLKAVSF